VRDRTCFSGDSNGLRGVELLSLRSRGEAQLLSSSVAQGVAQLTPHTLLLLLLFALLSVCCNDRPLLLLPAQHWQSTAACPYTILPLHVAAQ
jgi:hypothetical protein